MSRQTKLIYYLIITLLTLTILFFLRMLMQYPFFIRIKGAFFSVFYPFLISFIIVYVLHPILFWIEKRFSIKTYITTIILMSLYMVLLIGLINFFIPLLVRQFYDIIVNFTEYNTQINNFLVDLLNRYTNMDAATIANYMGKFETSLSNNIGKTFVPSILHFSLSLFNYIWVGIMIMIIIFIMMKDYSLFYHTLNRFLEKHKRSDWMILLKNIDKKLGAYIRGQAIIVSYMFIGTFISLTLQGTPNAFFFAISIALTNLIPYIGPFIGGAPLVLYTAILSPQLLIGAILTILGMQQFDNNIGQPLVYGSQLSIHPLIVMIIMMVGGAFFHLIGFVIAIPIFILIREIYQFIRYKMKEVQHEVEKSA